MSQQRELEITVYPLQCTLELFEMSELSSILNLLNDPQANRSEISYRIHRLDEDFSCSAMDASKLWHVAQQGRIPAGQFEAFPVAVLSNTTQDFFLPYLYAAGFACGLDLKIVWPGYNRIVDVSVNQESVLYEGRPQVVFINYNLEAQLGFAYHTTLLRRERAQIADDFLNEIRIVVSSIRKNLPRARIVIHSLYWYYSPVLGFIDSVRSDGPSDISSHLNMELCAFAAASQNVYVLDMQRVVAQVGFTQWRNNNRWFGEAVDTVNGNAVLARECLKFIKAFTKRNRKVIVLDLDNTLWGGLAGEDGLAGVALGNEYPGNVYKQFQRTLRLYSQRGVLLAINSKNNEEDALTIIREHPEMALREEDFVALRINWTDKIDNMKSIARELNLATDSFIFIDDSPQERALVRHALPEVLVPEFPAQVSDLPYLLEKLNDLDYDSFTDADRERTQLYKMERVRLEMKREATTLEDYFRLLETELSIRPAEDANLGRLEQMFQRTNQFNLTTKRYTLNELNGLAISSDHALVVASMKDKFGALGIIAAAVLAFGERAMIDSFLMSCRVIGRGVETAVLAHLVKLAAERGYGELYGAFVGTRKNELSRGLYVDHGFTPWDREGDVEIYVLTHLNAKSVQVPAYIEVIT
jgi:FkbH-like protein